MQWINLYVLSSFLSRNPHFEGSSKLARNACALWLQEAAQAAERQVTGLRDEHSKSLGELRSAVAAAKATRNSDLEIIERALTAAHDNHEAVWPALF